MSHAQPTTKLLHRASSAPSTPPSSPATIHSFLPSYPPALPLYANLHRDRRFQEDAAERIEEVLQAAITETGLKIRDAVKAREVSGTILVGHVAV